MLQTISKALGEHVHLRPSHSARCTRTTLKIFSSSESLLVRRSFHIQFPVEMTIMRARFSCTQRAPLTRDIAERASSALHVAALDKASKLCPTSSARGCNGQIFNYSWVAQSKDIPHFMRYINYACACACSVPFAVWMIMHCKANEAHLLAPQMSCRL